MEQQAKQASLGNQRHQIEDINITNNELLSQLNPDLSSHVKRKDLFNRRKTSEEIKGEKNTIDERESEYNDTRNMASLMKSLGKGRDKKKGNK